MYAPLSDRVGYVPGGTNIGIIRNDPTHVTLIDTGLNDTTARKVLRVVRDELHSEVVAILNTHGHADHFGANAFVRKRTGCEVWAPDIEATVIRHPILQPAFLYGGADPLDTLRSRFLLAEASPVDGIAEIGPQDFFGAAIEVVALPGHSPNHTGVLVDGVFFCADVVFPEAAIEKYRIPYLYGLTDHLASLDAALAIPAGFVVPGHGPHSESIDALVGLNHQAIDRTLAAIANTLQTPSASDRVCTEVFRALDVPALNAQGFFLLKPTINAYLAHLERTGVAVFEVVEQEPLWSLA
ncbi:MAG: MBL fold metallo-hydrolase [Chloroflexia bacterium]|nr:MBL fold metallo-hydrolase [Chloroflexia bacterium]